MFFTLVKNYFRSKWDCIRNLDISSKKTKRIKKRFEISGYIIDIDFLSLYERTEFKSISDLNDHYVKLMEKGDVDWILSGYFSALYSCVKKDDTDGVKTIVGFIEYVILTDRSIRSGFSFKHLGVRTYINSFKLVTYADIRNEKLNKLLQIK